MKLDFSRIYVNLRKLSFANFFVRSYVFIFFICINSINSLFLFEFRKIFYIFLSKKVRVSLQK